MFKSEIYQNQTDGSSACVFKNFEEDIIMLNSKKIASLGLALAMVASLAVPAFATEEETKEETKETNTSTEITSTYKKVAIAVTVPTTGTAQINPYGLPVEFTKSASSTKSAKATGQQIVTQPLYITNEGDVALDINASVSTTVNGMEIVTDKSAIAKSTDKQAYIELQMVQSANKSLADDTAKDKIIDEFATDATWTADGVSKLVLPAGGDDAVESEKALATLAASKVTTTTENGKSTSTVTYNAGSIVLFRLAGDVVTKPDTAWATTDTFTSTIAFSFTPATTEE
jgi:hypothetical protein